jgi:predicted site-specific integrase-resolvase
MTDQFLKVIDAPGLVRDPHSKAIIAADSSSLMEHRKKKQAMMALINKNKNLEKEVDDLKDRLSNIESLLQTIASNLNK